MGSAPEIVTDGEVGILAGAYQWDEMVAAINDGRLDDVDPHNCRELVQERFSVEAMLDGYEAAFEKIVASGPASRTQGDGLRRTGLLQN